MDRLFEIRPTRKAYSTVMEEAKAEHVEREETGKLSDKKRELME
jgi:hypothetical protein